MNAVVSLGGVLGFAAIPAVAVVAGGAQRSSAHRRRRAVRSVGR